MFLFDFLLFLSDRNLPTVKLYFYERICESWRSGSIPSAISSNSLWVNGKMCVFHCVCLCVRASGCHIRIRMCVMSDVVGVDDYAVTPAVNPSDKLGGMNTCDHLRARQHLGNHITYTHRSITCKYPAS